MRLLMCKYHNQACCDRIFLSSRPPTRPLLGCLRLKWACDPILALFKWGGGEELKHTLVHLSHFHLHSCRGGSWSGHSSDGGDNELITSSSDWRPSTRRQWPRDRFGRWGMHTSWPMICSSRVSICAWGLSGPILDLGLICSNFVIDFDSICVVVRIDL